MAVTLPAFTPLEDSLFLTLYARALDSRRPTPSSATPCPTRSSAPPTTTTASSTLTPTSSSTSPSEPRSWTRWPRRSWPAGAPSRSQVTPTGTTSGNPVSERGRHSWVGGDSGGGDGSGGDGGDSGGGSSQGQVVAGSNRAEALVSDRGRERDNQEHQPRSTHQSHGDRGRGMGGTRSKEATAADVPLRPARRALSLREISLRTQGRR